MKQLDTSPITDSAQMPIKKGTLDFLQAAYTEAMAAILIGMIGKTYDPTVVYVIYGVANTGSGSVYNISAGAVFYQGEIFYLDAVSFTATGSNVAVFSIVVTQFTGSGGDADPVTFTDTSVHNIMNIRKMQIVQGLPGSTISDLTAAIYMSLPVPPQLQLTAPVSGPFAGNLLSIIGAYPNLQLFVAPSGNLNPVIFAGTKNIGNLAGGNNVINITFGVILPTGDYYVEGTFVSNPGSIDTGADSTITWSISGRTDAGMVLTCREVISVTQDVSFEYVLKAK